MIRLDALRALVAVADHGNIKDAADQLHRTTSALSMTLKQIEDRLGGPLFEADRKQTLTELGSLVRDTGVILLRDYDRAMEAIAAHAGAFSGRPRLASVPSVAVMLLPQALREFLQTRPRGRCGTGGYRQHGCLAYGRKRSGRHGICQCPTREQSPAL